MNLTDRLRGVLRPSGDTSGDVSRPSDRVTPAWSTHIDEEGVDHVSVLPTSSSRNRCVAEVLGGEWRDARGHAYVTVDHRYSVGHRLGRVSVGECLPDADGSWPELPLLVGNTRESAPAGRMLFVDLETTGLAGGAGTCAFLVGAGWFEDTSFRVRQFLLTSYSAERALLQDVAALAAEAGTLVTYNGKTFDLPLIETRFLFHRMPPPFEGIPHLDMLHRARRLWRAPSSNDIDRAGIGERAQSSCRLSAVEESVLGYVREDDVSGFEAPARYFHFVRTGDARPLAAVFEHNRLDLLSLAMLTATAATLLQEGPDGARTAHEALGLGRLYELSGLTDKARRCFAKAASLEGPGSIRAEALRAFAVSCRRARCFEEAADAWRRILALDDCPAAIVKDATDALAVHHEHRLRDLQTARTFALQALGLSASEARREAARHRVARLDRKLTPSRRAAPLFG